ncbi:hypothetical protein HGRIS_011139 [Hohenbuehelia grisea]|uniref:Uncharacterized protein n=1 Tax=Hohenbuehelia grisea TaxID=104357 RepID=A0ABR3IZR2_9AGAR
MRITPTLRSAAGVSAALKERVRRPSMFTKLARAEDLAPLFKNDDYVRRIIDDGLSDCDR